MWRSLQERPSHITDDDQTEAVLCHTFKLTSVSSPGNLPLHHQAVKGAGRHQESSVQQILLPTGGLVLVVWVIMTD